MSSPVLDASDVVVRFGDRVVLNQLSLSADRGETIALVGASGSGKSTFLNCVLGLQRCESGRIVVSGHDMAHLSGRALAGVRRSTIGVVFQSGELLEELTPAENVTLPALLAGAAPSAARARAAELLDRLGVTSTGRSITEYSGGERQRIAVARALVNNPALLLADEPTGSLDPSNGAQVADLLLSVPLTFGCAVVLVTHDPTLADRATRIVQLGSDGAPTPA